MRSAHGGFLVPDGFLYDGDRTLGLDLSCAVDPIFFLDAFVVLVYDSWRVVGRGVGDVIFSVLGGVGDEIDVQDDHKHVAGQRHRLQPRQCLTSKSSKHANGYQREGDRHPDRQTETERDRERE